MTARKPPIPNLPRRQFLGAAAAATAFTIVPRHVLGGPRHIAPSDRVNIAGVGVGGMGRANLQALVEHEPRRVVRRGLGLRRHRFARHPEADRERRASARSEATDAVQKERAQQQIKDWQELQAQLPKTKRYTDYREMLAKQKNIDAVVIATPDHTHACIALAAMDLGKHVYVQKPLAWSVEECRRLATRATATQAPDADGQPGSFVRRRAPGQRIHPVRRHRHRHRSARVDQPSARLLAAGNSAPCPVAAEREGPALEHERRDDARRGIVRNLRAARQTRLGPVPRSVALRRLPPYLPPVQLARLDRLGRGRHRRHGRAPHRFGVLVAGSRLSDQRSKPHRRRTTRTPTRWPRPRTTSSRPRARGPR